MHTLWIEMLSLMSLILLSQIVEEKYGVHCFSGDVALPAHDITILTSTSDSFKTYGIWLSVLRFVTFSLSSPHGVLIIVYVEAVLVDVTAGCVLTVPRVSLQKKKILEPAYMNPIGNTIKLLITYK